MADEQVGSNTEQPQQQFAMQRIYTKDLSFESPATPAVFKEQWQPKINVELNTRAEPIDEEGNFDVVLTVTVTAKVEEETAFFGVITGKKIEFILDENNFVHIFFFQRDSSNNYLVVG